MLDADHHAILLGLRRSEPSLPKGLTMIPKRATRERPIDGLELGRDAAGLSCRSVGGVETSGRALGPYRAGASEAHCGCDETLQREEPKMRRKVFDVLASAGGVVFVVMLLVAGCGVSKLDHAFDQRFLAGP